MLGEIKMFEINTLEDANKIIVRICKANELEYDEGRAWLCNWCNYCERNCGECILDKG